MHRRRPVAQGASAELQTKIKDRIDRTQSQKLLVSSVPRCPSVLRVTHQSDGTYHKHYVLTGLHRGTTFFDDDAERTSAAYQPVNSPASFWIVRGTALYDQLPGLIPVACTCKDYKTRCTSTATGSAGGMKSVNDSRLVGSASVMGAIEGCKHMMAANEYMSGGTGPRAYFGIGLPS